MKQALLIFTKNLIHGEVKTRLAATVGNELAFLIYSQLLEHTDSVTKDIPFDKFVFYSSKIEQDDVWNDSIYKKQVQTGNDLGERMRNAFAYAFNKDYQKVVIIGTDCPALTEKIIHDAFKSLEEADVVIGPASDGGYYLLGLKQLHPYLFENIQWSTANVFPETIKRCKQNNLLLLVLEQLHDVDEEQDLVYMEDIKR